VTIIAQHAPMPTRPEPSQFDIDKKPLIDLTPNEETLAVIRRWFNPPIVAGMVIGEDVYGPIKMTASADDVLPTTRVFQFEPMRTPMIFELNAVAEASTPTRLTAAQRSADTFFSKRLKTSGKKPTNGAKPNRRFLRASFVSVFALSASCRLRFRDYL
jgi:hypothetical protein